MIFRHAWFFLLISFCSIQYSWAQPVIFSSDAENLGTGVNSKFAEVSPVITPDGKGIYVNRKDHPDNTKSSGNNDDIWFSSIGPSGTWSKAVNMGYPLNNGGHNFVSSVTPDGNQLLVENVYRKNGFTGPGV